MTRAMLLTLLVLVAAADRSALAEPRSLTDASKGARDATAFAFRYELAARRTHRESLGRVLQPERVYVVYERTWKQWIYVLTDKKGELPRPYRGLAPGSVLLGQNLGGNRGQRYRLDDKADWVATKAPLQHRVWVASRPPEFRVYLVPGG